MTSSDSIITPILTPAAKPKINRNFASIRTISALILREVSTQYGRTPGGALWSILEPLAAIMFLSVGFRLVLRTAPIGNSFMLYFSTGYMFFALYLATSNPIARSLKFSKPLLKYPAVTWLDAILARFIINALTGIITMSLLIGGVLVYLQNPVTPDMQTAATAAGLALLVGLGIGCLNCTLIGLFPIWDVTWKILTRPLFLASGIFYIYDSLPPLAQDILWYNPLIHIVGLARSAFYPTYSASYVSITYVSSFGIIALILGLILTRRYHREILNR